MSTLTFDTLKFVQKLEKAGVSREQATAEAEALAEVFESGGQDIASKSDLRAETARLENRIDSLAKDMQAMELRLTIKLGALMTVAIGAVAGLVKLL